MIKALWYILIGRVDPEAVIKLAEGTHHIKRKGKRLPTIMDLRGIAPNCTGGLSSEEFVAKIRAEKDSLPTAETKEG